MMCVVLRSNNICQGWTKDERVVSTIVRETWIYKDNEWRLTTWVVDAWYGGRDCFAWFNPHAGRIESSNCNGRGGQFVDYTTTVINNFSIQNGCFSRNVPVVIIITQSLKVRISRKRPNWSRDARFQCTLGINGVCGANVTGGEQERRRRTRTEM